jgi:phosphatidylethanolamine/phosphatidyl-N-methylethanolamine N-methyltransferase
MPTAPTPDASRAYWDRHARHYDRSMLVLGRPLPRAIALVQEEVRGLGSVLEVAAGTGLFTLPIAAVAGRVVATDFSQPMVGVLRERLAARGVRNVECERRDLYTLGWPPESFDAVVCANVLHLVPDLDGALAALRAVLRPGGSLVAPTFAHGETALSRLLSRASRLVGFPVRRRLATASLAAAIERAGLEVTRTETIPGIFPIAFVAARRR